MNHLPDEAARIATEQGWNDESIIIHLLGFIQHDASGEAPEEPAWEARLAVYLRTCADDERIIALYSSVGPRRSSSLRPGGA